MRTALTLIFLLVAPLCALHAQVPKLADIDKGLPAIKLDTKTDDDGLKQFDFAPSNCPACQGSGKRECQHCAPIEKPEKCPECDLTRKAPCPFCAGKGSFASPLELAICPGCAGHGWSVCYLCGNNGVIVITGGNKGGLKCSACKGAAGIACTVCDGERLVPALYGGKAEKADLKKLKKTRENLDALIAAVEAFEAKGKARDDRKAFAALFKATSRDLPPLKDLIKFVDSLSKGFDQPIYKENERQQVHAYDRIKYYLLMYLVHQSRVLNACIERAEFNEKVEKSKD